MSKIIHHTAILLNILMILTAIFFVTQSVSMIEVIVALGMLLPPITSIFALYWGPDLEERRLQRTLNKVRIKRELQEIKKSVK